MPSDYCPRIHHGLTLTDISSESITYAACCWGRSNIKSKGIIEWHHADLDLLRQQNKMGMIPPDYCQSCIDQEQAGQKSMRMGYIELHQAPSYDNSLQYLDINIDYTCNLACVTCGPEYSTTWRKELDIKNLSVRPKIENFLKTFDSLDFSTLKEIRFWGGEPFLTRTHEQILDFIAARCDTSTIKLMYNTNGTQRISDQTRELLEEFKFVRISFSVDGTGKKFEYLRYPGCWNEVEDNLLWWRENLPHNSMLSLTTTASIFNVLDLGEIFDWKKLYFDKSKFQDDIEIFVHQAFGWAGLENMTPEMAQTLKSLPDYCQPWIQQASFLSTKSHGPATFVARTKEIDSRRNVRLPDILPEVARLMHYHA
jgi:sulfatase maturation enzyme AslB (radical SAM superfamily)